MKAAVFNEHGGPEVLEYTDFPTPEIEPHQVLVDVKAVALNHLDLFVRGGIPGLKLEMPHILGSDISGVVHQVGDAVTGFEIGQKVIVDPSLPCRTCEFCLRGEQSLCNTYRIIGEQVRGGYSDFFAADAQNVISVPKESGLDFVEAAAVRDC